MIRDENMEKILSEQGTRPERLIPILRQIQDEYGYLPEACVRYAAERLRMSPARVWGVASFYESFVFQHGGKYVLRICDGTTCHSRGAGELVEAVYRKLGITAQNNTTPDGLITVETVACLGACALSPNLELNGRIFTRQTLETIMDTIEIIQMSQEEMDE